MSEYIKREEVLEKRQRIPNYGMLVDAVSIKDIERIPAADVEPVVRGEWKLVYKEAPALFECSVCGNRELYADSEFDFCPSCGSVMTEAGRKKIMERSGSGE